MSPLISLKKNIFPITVAILCFAYFLLGFLVSTHRFWQYQAGYYDFGIFDTAIWSVSRFKAPIIDHFVVGGKVIFADHFSPSIFLISPVYWLTSRSEVLLLVQSAAVAVSGYFLFLISKHFTKNKLAQLATISSYFLFIGLQNAIIFDFHPITVATLPMMISYWSIIKKNKKVFLISFFITLGFKESLALWGIGLSFFIYLFNKEWRKTAFFVLLSSLLWGIIASQVIIPYFSGNSYHYNPNLSGGIFSVIHRFFDSPKKIKTVFQTMESFLFLPILHPPSLIIILTNFASRFLTSGPIRWDLGLHYNAEIAPTLGLSTAIGFSYIRKFFRNKVLSSLSILLILYSLYLHQFVFRGPLNLAFRPIFYEHTKQFEFLNKPASLIPKNASVVTQNNLTIKFLHQEVWILTDSYKKHNPDYIFIDVRSGQNPSNFLGNTEEGINLLLEKIKNDKDFVTVYNEGDQFVFKNISLTTPD